MRQLIREERGIWFAPYSDKSQVVDEDGHLTGEYAISYGRPQLVVGTVSPRTGNTWGDGFGIGVDCDRTVIIDEIGIGIDESWIAWIDVRPQLDDDGMLYLDDNGLPVVPNDYEIVMAGESYNFTRLAVRKVG